MSAEDATQGKGRGRVGGLLPWEICQFVWRETGGVNKLGRGGFTASWSISVVGQSQVLGMVRSDPGGRDDPDQHPNLKHTPASQLPPKLNTRRRRRSLQYVL